MPGRIAEALVFAATACSASPALASAPDPPAPTSLAPEGHHFFFSQALGLLVRRVSVGYELQPRTHHSFTIASFLQYPGSTGPEIARGGAFGTGSELGYRYYDGAQGPSGAFFGVSLIGGYYISKEDFYDTKAKRTPYAQYGVAVDMGYAIHIDRTTTGVLAVGAQRTWVDIAPEDITPYARLVVGAGVRPRLLLQIGRIF